MPIQQPELLKPTKQRWQNVKKTFTHLKQVLFIKIHNVQG